MLGGGAVGLATANALLGAGARVTSIYPGDADVERPAASRAAGAMLGAIGEITADDGAGDRTELDFRLAAQRMYPEWLGEIFGRAGMKPLQGIGTFVVANTASAYDRESLKRMKVEAARVGEPAESVEPDDIPGLRPSPRYWPVGCLHLPNEHSVDGQQLLDALAASAQTYTGWQHVDDVALSARRERDVWAVALRSGRTVCAPELVLCAGSRSFEVVDADVRAEAGLPRMFFGKGVSCVLADAPPMNQPIRTPNRAFACGVHVVPRANGHLYVGATNCPGIDHERARGVQPGELHSLFDDTVHQVNVGIRESRIVDIRVGYRPIVAGRRPIVGRTRVPGLSVGTGSYRNGVLMAPLMANIIAGDITGAPRAENPFDASAEPDTASIAELCEVGVRDIVSFLQEPRGALPYDRAEDLRRYVTTLFQMAVVDDEQVESLRSSVRRRLEEEPLNETMHALFYELVERTETVTPARAASRGAG